MAKEKIDVIDFAKRVERLCDFLLDKIPVKDGSVDQVTIEHIKEEAADIQAHYDPITLEGLHTYMRGG